MRYLIAAALLAATVALASGCATIRSANCERLRMVGYNVLVCDDGPVGEHCAKGARVVGSTHQRLTPIADNGKVVDYKPRACFEHRPKAFGRRPILVIGRSYIGCAFHEICHYERPLEPAYCAENVPCLGDK